MNKNALSDQKCEPCQSGTGLLNQSEAKELMTLIHVDWTLSDDGQQITRSLKFKNFAKTMFFINALAHMADQQGHHPDVSFGYNYARITYTTHEANGLTRNDFICARQADDLLKTN